MLVVLAALRHYINSALLVTPSAALEIVAWLVLIFYIFITSNPEPIITFSIGTFIDVLQPVL